MEIKFTITYFIVVSLYSIILTLLDKYNAIKGKSRVSEKKLFITSFLGGAFSMYITMNLVRHKTKKKKFMIGLPLIFILQSAALYFAFVYLF